MTDRKEIKTIDQVVDIISEQEIRNLATHVFYHNNKFITPVNDVLFSIDLSYGKEKSKINLFSFETHLGTIREYNRSNFCFHLGDFFDIMWILKKYFNIEDLGFHFDQASLRKKNINNFIFRRFNLPQNIDKETETDCISLYKYTISNSGYWCISQLQSIMRNSSINHKNQENKAIMP